jgi:hypothetical protein
MSIRRIVLVGGVLVALVGCITAVLLARRGNSDGNKQLVKNATTTSLSDSQVGLVVNRDASLTEKSISKEDSQKGQLWEVTQPTGSRQEFVINAFYEQGDSLKKLTGYTKQPLRDSVMASINLQLPKQYPGYKELIQRNLTVNGTDASETIFEYTNSGARIKQRLLLLFKNSDTAVYIRAQAKAEEYEAINTQYFEPLLTSAKFH